MHKLSIVAAVLVGATLLAHPFVIGGGMGPSMSAQAAVWKKGKMGKGKMGKGKMGKGKMWQGKMGKGKMKGKGPQCFQRCVSKGHDPKRCNKRCG